MKDGQQKEFQKPSNYPLPDHLPPDVTPWKYRYEYPENAQLDAPWFEKEFLKGGILNPKVARDFCDEIKKYFAKNQDKFFHAPWLHRGDNGREPVSGLRYGGQLEQGHLSDKQDKIVQGWVNHFYNPKAATVLAKIWGKGDQEPKWNPDNLVKFPEGSLLVEEVYCDVGGDQVYTLKNKESPKAWACIAEVDSEGNPIPSQRKRTAEPLHLIQLDFRTRAPDSWKLPIGWVYGTFIYDGTKEKPNNNWVEDLIPVGVQWGNDPSLTQDTHNDGAVSKECWVNGHALDVYRSLKGATAGLGWHGRLDGPADNFMSTCSSCHAVSQTRIDRKIIGEKELKVVMDPLPKKLPVDDETKPGIYVQQDPEAIQHWFRNVKAGVPFDSDKVYMSADYCWGLQIGYQNYLKWVQDKPSKPSGIARPFKSGWV